MPTMNLFFPRRQRVAALRILLHRLNSTVLALDEGYRYALVSVCTGDRDRIVTLDSAVRDACAKARLAPRYAQYLALLLFAHWNTARLEDSEGFLARLNGSNPHPNPSPASGRGALISESLEAFTATDLQTAAFWMATAAGKTHVLHAGQAGQAHTDVLGTLRPVNAGRILALLLWLHFSGRGSNPHSLTFRLQTETTASLGPLIRAETLERLHFFGNAHRHQQGFQPLAQDE